MTRPNHRYYDVGKKPVSQVILLCWAPYHALTKERSSLVSGEISAKCDPKPALMSRKFPAAKAIRQA